MKIFVLTSAYNLYDQHGVYFIKAFATKPSAEQLKEAIADSGEGITDEALENLIKNGGGRMMNEDLWWYLEEVMI